MVMAQTESGQNGARRKLASSEMGKQRTNERAQNKVAPLHNPKVSVGSRSQNTPALRKRKFMDHAGITPPTI